MFPTSIFSRAEWSKGLERLAGLSRIHAGGQASRLSLTSKNFRLSGWDGLGFAALCRVWILRRWRQARRLSYALLSAACLGESHGGEAAPGESGVVVTNVAQFRSAPREAFLGRCAFQLDGVVTLVDTNRDLLVLQDETGAVALKPRTGLWGFGAQVGQRVSLEGSRCFPSVLGFPNYPYRPSSREVLPSFEAPTNSGNHYLTRMQGHLHPPATGEYTFWIASDNSSELWLSSDDDPTKVKKIAFMSRYSWVAPREWSRYPSQRSEKIVLRAGHSYYIEAFQEQTMGGDHLAVAWEGPSVRRSIIANRYLTPWLEERESEVRSQRSEVRGPTSELRPQPAVTNGVRREYWSNFSLGGLATLTGPKPFESVLSVDELRMTAHGAETWPPSHSIDLSQPLLAEDNYRWVEAEGTVTFTGGAGEIGLLELSDGQAQVQVRVLRSEPGSLRRFHNSTVRVEGVCEGVYNREGVLMPGLIWASKENGIALIETAKTNLSSISADQPSQPGLTNNPAMTGFYGTRGVITFNDRVFGQDCLFVQEDAAALFVSLTDRNFGKQFEVGRWVDVGGNLQPGRNISILNPMVMTELGWHSMPAPMKQPIQFPVPGSRDGRWTEAGGVAHVVNSNGTIMLMGSGEPLSVWIGKTSTDALSQYVDAKLRVRGVLSLTIQDAPLLLVPSKSFVDVEREAPRDPFAVPAQLVSNLFAGDVEMAMPHRVKLAGNVTFNGKGSFFVQDASGGVRVRPVEDREMQIGQAVELVGFPSAKGSGRTLTEALVRPTGGVRDVQPQKLDAGEGISFKHAGTLAQISASLIAQRTRNGSQVLELQEKQRVFEAELPLENGTLPAFAPGSRIQLSGVCDFAAVTPAASGNATAESPSTGALKIWLRSPADVVLLSGPPWWTWKHTTALVGTLLTILVASLLRIHLLRRRLERQLTFSRQILESQESERHRIAANLHDSLGQNLLVIKNQARLAMQQTEGGSQKSEVRDQNSEIRPPTSDLCPPSSLRQRLDEISGCASQAIEDVREITHALRPYQLDRLGLTQTIRATVSRAAENSSILFASHADDVDGLFDKESEIHVYRIVQEAVNNILKHSGATEAATVVKKLEATVSMSIRDNGRGFDADALYQSNSHDVGHGISGIKERVRILGGTFVIDSRPGQGTSLSIEIPVPVSKHESENRR